MSLMIGLGLLATFAAIGGYNAYTAWKQGDPILPGGRERAPRQGSALKYIVRQFGIYILGVAILGVAAFLAATRG